MFVEFSDETETTIVSVFSCGQDSDAFPFQGEVPQDDPRLLQFLESIPAGMRNQINMNQN